MVLYSLTDVIRVIVSGAMNGAEMETDANDVNYESVSGAMPSRVDQVVGSENKCIQEPISIFVDEFYDMILNELLQRTAQGIESENDVMAYD